MAIKMANRHLGERAAVPVETTPSRALDVALWMRHRLHHTGHGCPGLT
jgi:hypothetical protein